MASSPRLTAAQVLAAHSSWERSTRSGGATAVTCECGVELTSAATASAPEEWVVHVLAAFADAGIVCRSVPRGVERDHVAYGHEVQVIDYLGWDHAQISVEPTGMVMRGVPYTGPYRVQYMRGASGTHYSIEAARQYADALLAAADAAEQSQNGSMINRPLSDA